MRVGVRPFGAVAVLVLALALVAACHSGAKQSAAADAGPSCLTASPSASSGSPSASSGVPASAVAPTGGLVPGLALDCFSGPGTARLTDLHAPAIVTLWAAWCGPCATEMPAFQAVADKARGRVRVIGVVTFDQHDHAQAFIDEHKVTFPMLDDPDKHLLTAVGRAGLPVTLFVTADGHLAHLYDGTALDQPTLESMTAKYLGVAA